MMTKPETGTLLDRMEHVHVGVRDIERSLRFYTEVLGFRLRYDGRGGERKTVHLGSDRFYVAMTEKEGLPRHEANPTAEIYHVGFVTDDLSPLRKRLADRGVPLTYDVERAEGPAIYFEDPDGHEIEVVEYVENYEYR